MLAKDSHYFPIALACFGVMTFSLMDVVMKAQALSMGVYNAMFWRMAIGATLMTLLYRPTPTKLIRGHWDQTWRLHLIRAVLSASMLYLLFFALTRIPLAQAVGLAFIAPIVALFLAPPILGERINRSAKLSALLGFGGVAVVAIGEFRATGSDSDWLGLIAVLVFAFLYGLNLVLQRKQALLTDAMEIVFFQNVLVFIILLTIAPLYAIWPDSSSEWAGSAAAALLAVCSLLLLTRAYRLAEAQKLVSIEYTAFIWAAIFGWLVFSETVSLRTLLGTALIVLGCFISASDTKSNSTASE